MTRAERAMPSGLPRLAQLVGSLAGGPAVPAAPIDDEIAALARRHQLGAMLLGAAERGGHTLSPEAKASLTADYRASADRGAAGLARLMVIGSRFAERGISWMALKGPTQAALL